MQQAVAAHDLSNIEDVASSSGADGATVLCYLHPAYDGRQPGRCPTLYYRDTTATMTSVGAHRMWVMLEAASGIVAQHDFDPSSSWHGAPGGAWWNVTNDPYDPSETDSPLWGFVTHRALNRLALRTKLNLTSNGRKSGGDDVDYFEAHGGVNCSECRPIGKRTLGKDDAAFTDSCAILCRHTASCGCFVEGVETYPGTAYRVPYCQNYEACPPSAFQPSENSTLYLREAGPGPLPTHAGGALAYLKHDALGPDGDAAVVLFNPGAAQRVTVALGDFPEDLMGTVPTDLLTPTGAKGPPLSRAWSVAMGAGEVKAFGGFSLGSFAPRTGKRTACAADDAYRRPASGHTLEACFLECLTDAKCGNVFIDHVEVPWMARAPPVQCTLLGAIADPSSACKSGDGTLVKKLPHGRPRE